jgi:hypothetical protein
VLYVVSNLRDVPGQAALDDLEPLRRAVKRALTGWTPSRRYEEVRFFLGELAQMEGDGKLWWGDEFTVNHYPDPKAL